MLNIDYTEDYSSNDHFVNDVVSRYLKDLGRFQLLTREGEVFFANTINSAKRDIDNMILCTGYAKKQFRDVKQKVFSGTQRAIHVMKSKGEDHIAKCSEEDMKNNLNYFVSGLYNVRDIESAEKCWSRLKNSRFHDYLLESIRSNFTYNFNKWEKNRDVFSPYKTKYLLGSDPVSPEVFHNLEDRVHDAASELIKGNLRLVVYEVKKHYNFSKIVQFIDLIQEGNMGLMKASYRFNPNFKNRFSTFASGWIRQSINRGSQNTKNTIRLPANIHSTIIKMQPHIGNSFDKLDYSDCVSELVKLTGKTKSQVLNALAALQNYGLLSLDSHIADDNSCTYMDITANESSSNPEEEAHILRRDKRLKEHMAVLPKKSRTMLDMRFKNDMTLQEIGNEFGVCRERIRQLINNDLEILRDMIVRDASSYSEHANDFL